MFYILDRLAYMNNINHIIFVMGISYYIHIIASKIFWNF